MKQVYPTFILEDEGYHLVYVPDMEIYTQGEGFVNAIEMARDAIGLKGIVLEDNGLELPVPSSSALVMEKALETVEDIDFTKGVLTFVDIDFAEYRRAADNKTVRRNVTLPNWLNVEAERANINVSGVLQEALMKALGVKRPY